MTTRRRLRLLPQGTGLGWTPFAWLMYLPTFFVEPVIRTQLGEASALYWTLTILATIGFLSSYFRAFWARGNGILRHVGFQAALGIAFAPFNVGSCVFFVYAGSFCGRLDRERNGWQAIITIAILGAATAFLTHAPLYFWLTAIGITLIVGGVNLHFAQASHAQRKLRLAQDEIEHLAKVAERERIARDLHDVLGHTLSLVVLKAELAARLVERDPVRAATEMRDVETVARRTLQDVREAIRGYHASLEDEIGRARSMLKAARIEADFEIEAPSLDRVIDETLALSLREAITNCVRHSGAGRCSVRLTSDDRTVTLDIADDGGGAGRSPEGAGLRGMRERVEALAGTIERPVGGGMCLRITLGRTLPTRSDRPADRDLAG
jgi:two-component system, NarL family, sensor histidine kinase DesK